MTSKLFTSMNLSDRERMGSPPVLSKLKTVHEWLSSAVESMKDVSDFSETLAKLSPWALAGFEATKEVLPPVKFVVKVFEELTKVQEPETLARLACTLAYQKAAQAAFEEEHPTMKSAIADLRDSLPDENHDFRSFTLEQALSHPFIHHADRAVEFFARQAGYSNSQLTVIISKVHDRFPDELQHLISHHDTKEKFDPLWRWLRLDPEGLAARAALRRHAEYTDWIYRRAPVLEHEPYALEHIYVETECSKLTRAQLHPDKADATKPRPFDEGEDNGGRYPLLGTVLDYIRPPKFRDAIVIQGTAASGKSSFTLRLAAALREEGFRPLRIRLRDVNVTKEFFTALSEAIALEDEIYLRENSPWPAVRNILLDGAIFQDEIPYAHGTEHMRLCPYVLILDGWDELSVAVSEGFKQRVKELLMDVRRELLKSYGRIVRVILTGRPSDAVDDCADFFLPDTPVLTLRLLKPEQLIHFAGRWRQALEEQLVRTDETSLWAMPPDSELQTVFKAYEQDFASHTRLRRGESFGQSDTASVIGTPFLAQLAFRLLADWKGDRYELVRDRTKLMRSLVDFVTHHAHRPSDRVSNRHILPRFSGPQLRSLLHRTAAHIASYGQESIPRAELEERLDTQDLERSIRQIAKENVISGLIISFYFKGGNTALGCEFTHKAFREYLFAEAIVETLKSYGRKVSERLSEREPYWKDFDADTDPRWQLTEEMAALLAPHWLTPEVVTHLGNLFEWEMGRDLRGDEENGIPGCTDPLSLEGWRRIRDGLADVWDWWAEGVHMRMQPQRVRGQVEWRPARVEGWVRDRAPREPLDRRSVPVPVRFNTLDAHLGDGLLRLNAWVHYWIIACERRTETLVSVRREKVRKHQAPGDNRYVLFRPSGKRNRYFGWYLNRINSAGWYPNTGTPSGVFLRGVDLCYVEFILPLLVGADLREANLMGANLRGANLYRAALYRTDLYTADLRGALNLDQAQIDSAFCDDATKLPSGLVPRSSVAVDKS